MAQVVFSLIFEVHDCEVKSARVACSASEMQVFWPVLQGQRGCLAGLQQMHVCWCCVAVDSPFCLCSRCDYYAVGYLRAFN